MTRVGAAALGLAVMAAGGCAAPGPTTSLLPTDATSPPQVLTPTPTAAATGARYLGPLTSPVTYAGGDFKLVSPGRAVPRKPWTASLLVCRHSHPRCVEQGHAPTITLARATSPHAGASRRDGSIKPLMNAALVYVLHWTGLRCMPVGPVPAPDTTPTQRIPSPCDALRFVDANTGTELYGEDYPAE